MVSRIALLVFLAVLVTAGCGSSALRPEPAVHVLPRAQARAWAVQAARIADAAAAGDSCRARRLAGALRTSVISAGGTIPVRLRTPLLQAVNSLADRIVCVIPPRTVTITPPAPQKPKGPKEHPPHGHHGHGGGDQGKQS